MNEDLKKFYDDWGKWFAQSPEEKMKALRQPGKGGYYPRGESPGYEAEPDPKEYFHWRILKDHPLGDTTSPIFWDCFYKAEDWVVERGLDDLWRHVHPEECVLRILHYPPHPTGAVGQAHRDFDLLTVSVEGTAPGLEVFNTCFKCGGRGWIFGHPDENPCQQCHGYEQCWFLQEEGVQIGEMLEIYTHRRSPFRSPTEEDPGLLQATPHRVRTPPDTDRLKAVFFYLPSMDFELKPGFTAKDYLYGPNGVLVKAGTAKIGAK